MCGIVGYIGGKNAAEMIIEGLKRLEYRGYDSVGAAISDGKRITVIKRKGRVSCIADEARALSGTAGIGHTRWATHGKPNDNNSHPQTSGKFAVVHNGIIENFAELKIELINKGVRFVSETDTEVIAHLISENYAGDFHRAVVSALSRLKGSYAVAVLCEDFPDEIVVARKDNPLIVGTLEGEAMIASDLPALAACGECAYVLSDGEMAIVTRGNAQFFDFALRPIEKQPMDKAECAGDASLCGYESFMLKEIGEIPRAVGETAAYLSALKPPAECLTAAARAQRIVLIGCGTAYNSCITGRRIIEISCGRHVEIELASEFRYSDPILGNNAVVIAVSQSGETADTLAAVRLAKQKGAYVIAVTNVGYSSITRSADFTVNFKAGAEIAVAATKSYNCQLACFYYLADMFSGFPENGLTQKLTTLNSALEQVVSESDALIELAGRYSGEHSVFFLGRGLDYGTAVEGSLKLKEISYVHSEGYAAGELKHGTLALVEHGTLAVVPMTQRQLVKKTMNAVHEVKSRGAAVFALTQFEDTAACGEADYVIRLPDAEEIFMPMIAIVPLQLFAYYMSRCRGLDADKPRNLAKSVTVE